MNLHEYQAKELLSRYGVKVPRGKMVESVADAARAAEELGLPVVIKAQIHAGGRGKAGGVKLARTAADVPKMAGEILGKKLVTPQTGAEGKEVRKLLVEDVHRKTVAFLLSLYQAFRGLDCSLLEINPCLVTEEGEVLALDAKINLDDNALFRHKDLLSLRDITEEAPLEVEASKFGLNYIKLDGNVGCMVNGAGLAMATMDIIKLSGSAPANFLDVGGGASAEQVKNAFRILTSDPQVKAVLINIFGGILRCDRLAEGVIAAVQELGVKAPIVIRMEGTNVELGKKMLAESGLNFTTANSMKEAAEKVANLARSR